MYILELLRLVVSILLSALLGAPVYLHLGDRFETPRVTSSVAEVNGARLHCLEKGRGLPVVLIRGGNLDSWIWDPQFAPFAREVRVIRSEIQRAYAAVATPTAHQ